MGYTSSAYGYLGGFASLTVGGSVTLGPNGHLVMGSGGKVKLDTSTSLTDCPLQFNGDPNNGIRYAAADVWWDVCGGIDILARQSTVLTANVGLSAGGTAVVGGTATFSGLVVNSPVAAQSITGVGVAITALCVVREFTSDGNYTLTVAPTIADGTNGQRLTLVNVGANTVTIQDQGTLASSNLRLTGATVAIGPRDSIELYYSTAVGDWVQIGALVAVV